MATRQASLNVASPLVICVTLKVPWFGPTRRSSKTFYLPTKPLPGWTLQADKPNRGGAPNSEQFQHFIGLRDCSENFS
jgi:hypothetical protein